MNLNVPAESVAVKRCTWTCNTCIVR